MTAAFWVDEAGAEHQIDSSRPGAPGWSVVHFVDEGMALSMVQNRHVVIREQRDAPESVAADTGGEESTNQQEGDSAMQSTDNPASYLVLLIAAGLHQIVAHAPDFQGAIALINADTTRRFGWDEIEHTVTTGDYVRMTTTVGLEVEYRILPHDQPVPTDEPTVDQVEAATDALGALTEEEQLDGNLVVLAQVKRGPFTAEITKYARRAENGEIVLDELEVTIDSRDQAGGQMFSDLTILDGQFEDFAYVVNAIAAEYRAIVGQVK
ncbi:hypothetical protein ACFWCF_24785 [Rhodococcus sp. NPDC060090]|uniref:hypothetical protein n=1 Tax=Rhodococcus sp. NPDC060090 TaxID=3347056 RepID=UPI00365D80C1